MIPRDKRTALIVDRTNQNGFELRTAFLNGGADTHVVSSFAAANLLVQNKRIDVVVMEFAADPKTLTFCQTLTGLSVRYVFACQTPANSSSQLFGTARVVSRCN